MARYTMNQVIGILWNESGDEEDTSGDEFDENDEAYLRRRNQRIMILMEASQTMPQLAPALQSDREIAKNSVEG